MPSTSVPRCEQCGHQSAAQYLYCGMCGAKLPQQQPSPPNAPKSKKPERPAIEEAVRRVPSEPIRQVSEPSFLAPTDDTNSRLAYLLEDDLPESRWGRSVVLLLLLIGISVAGWHWREQLRTYVASHLAQHPNNQTDREIPAASDKVMTGVGDLPVTTAQTPGALDNGPDPVAPPGAENAALIQDAVAGSPAQNDTAPASNEASAAAPSNLQAATPAPIATMSPTATPSAGEAGGSAVQKLGQEVASVKQEAPASASVTRGKSRPTVKHIAPATSDADVLEAQREKYLYGTGVPTSCSLARRDLQTAAEHGNFNANRVLGTMYGTGHCVDRNLPLAYRWFAKALRQDPNNDRLAQDLQVLWSQMTPEERQIAMRR